MPAQTLGESLSQIWDSSQESERAWCYVQQIRKSQFPSALTRRSSFSIVWFAQSLKVQSDYPTQVKSQREPVFQHRLWEPDSFKVKSERDSSQEFSLFPIRESESGSGSGSGSGSESESESHIWLSFSNLTCWVCRSHFVTNSNCNFAQCDFVSNQQVGCQSLTSFLNMEPPLLLILTSFTHHTGSSEFTCSGTELFT